ncbi:MAG: two pore domain potassium channel family protein, partial [Candidatus Methylomirabilis sp.]
MTGFAAAAGIALILLALWDGFETIVLPRRVTRQIRLTRLFYRGTWTLWAAIFGILSSSPKRRETYLGFYGP